MEAIVRRLRRAFAALGVIALLAVFAAVGVGAAELELPVPTATLYPGDVIGNDQIVGRAFVAHTVARSAVYSDRQALIGKVVKRTLLPGQPIPLNGVREPYVVTQGKTALVVFEAGDLTITASATALQNGSIGDVVTLRNVDSGATIRGTIASDGTIRLIAP
jgi:flagella basal body P-ring formation protein FlgA